MLWPDKQALAPLAAGGVCADNERAFPKTTKEDISRATTKNSLA
jgi:hypothetical protein